MASYGTCKIRIPDISGRHLNTGISQELIVRPWVADELVYHRVATRDSDCPEKLTANNWDDFWALFRKLNRGIG